MMLIKELSHFEDFKDIKGCPSEGEDGNITLYRWVKDFNKDSFVPNAVNNNNTKRICEGWGLSTFNSLDSAIEGLNNLSRRRRKKFKAIVKSNIINDDGVKYKSRGSTGHYTFFPVKEFDCVERFIIVEELTERGK